LTTDLQARGATSTTVAAFSSTEADAATSGASELVSWAKEQLGKRSAEQQKAWSMPATEPLGEGDAAAHVNEPLRLHRLDQPGLQKFDIGRTSPDWSSNKETADESAAWNQRPDHASGGARSRLDDAHATSDTAGPQNALQVHNRYLVVETDAGIEVIDQHALHERILYEQIREKVLAGSMESQKLLVPEPVDLTATEAAAALEHAELLAQLGVEVQPFGGETVLVSSYPAMLANLSPAEVLRELVEKLLTGGRQPEARDLIDELLHMIACKAAVKFGDRLTTEEIEALLSQRHLAQDQHHCPHGRPTALVFTREDLDRQFKRI
jgi:DNA mismatch repair protein MutL